MVLNTQPVLTGLYRIFASGNTYIANANPESGQPSLNTASQDIQPLLTSLFANA